MSARCAGCSETENGQEQGELRAAANKATMFQPEWPGEAGELANRGLTEGVQEERFTFLSTLPIITLAILRITQIIPPNIASFIRTKKDLPVWEALELF